jgi:Ca2+-transporting ATPase
MFLGQFNSAVIWLLIIAAIVSGLLGEWIDTAAILAIVGLNGVLGFLQEDKSQRALASLEQLSAPVAHVRRGGQWHTVPASEVVPGDRVRLEAGDYVPADVRLLDSASLAIAEASLTGESVPVDKQADEVLEPRTALADRTNMAYLGTTVTAGKAEAVVVATGMHTEMGHIAGLLERSEREPTPLERRLDELGKVLMVVCLVLVAIIFGLQLWRGGDLVEVFLVSVSLAVAAVPEGLPAVVTLALALGLERMIRRNALVRKLPSVETLGAVTVICSDKTGTLTRNEMTVREVATSSAKYQVTGVGFDPQGSFYELSGDNAAREKTDFANLPTVDPKERQDLADTLLAASRCTTVQVRQAAAGESYGVIGDPTEAALVIAALKAGLPAETLHEELVHEIPFDSERKAMSMVFAGRSGQRMFTKGAPEIVLGRATHILRGGEVQELDEPQRQRVLDAAAGMAGRALRVLGLARRKQPLPAASTPAYVRL